MEVEKLFAHLEPVFAVSHTAEVFQIGFLLFKTLFFLFLLFLLSLLFLTRLGLLGMTLFLIDLSHNLTENLFVQVEVFEPFVALQQNGF